MRKTRMPAIIAVMLSYGMALSPAGAQSYTDQYPELLELTADELEQEIDDAKFYRVLRTSKTVIDSDATCAEFIRKARETDQELARLNREYRNSQPIDYTERATAIKQQNVNAIRDYKSCFTRALQGFPVLTAKGVGSYDAHRAKSAELKETYGVHRDLNGYIAALEQALQDLGGHDFAVRITVESATSGDDARRVQARRAGSTTWFDVRAGMELKRGDTIRTARHGRIKLNFSPASPAETSGPSIVNIGSSTEVRVDSLRVKHRIRGSVGVMSLLRGTVRAFSRNWGSESSFTIRTGTSLCGIRGTEVAVSYDPQSGVANYTLDHGDAYAEAGGQRVNLQPRTSVAVSGNSISRPAAVSQAEWDELVGATGTNVTPGTAVTNAERVETPSEEETRAVFRELIEQRDDLLLRSYLDAAMGLDNSGMLRNSTGDLRKFHQANFGASPIADAFNNYAIQCRACDEAGSRCEVLVELQQRSASGTRGSLYVASLEPSPDSRVRIGNIAKAAASDRQRICRR